MTNKDEKDLVYLNVFPRNFAKHVPNIGQFVVKMETWMRLNNIKYEVLLFDNRNAN